MRSTRSALLPAFALVLAAGLVFAGEEEPAKGAAPDRVLTPFLWEIPGEVPNYLFGTAHSTDERVTSLHPAVRQAFDACEAAYFEVDLLKDMPAQLAAIRLPEGQRTADLIPADLLKRLDARLTKINPSLTRARVGELKTLAWCVLVPNLHEQMKKPGFPMLDAKLYGEALQSGKTVGGLEKPAEQTAFMDSVTNDEALLLLRRLLDRWDAAEKKGEDPTAEVIGYYLRGDGPGLYEHAMEMTTGDEVPKDLAARLLQGLAYDRNERMAEAIAKHLQEQPRRRHFFAVGAMHLLGDRCVQDYLKKLGIETRRVHAQRVQEDAEPKPTDDEKPVEKKPASAGAGDR